MTHTFSQGESAAKDFPLPVYPESKPTGSVNAQSDGSDESSFMMLTSKDPIEKIARFYIDKLQEAGWSVKQNNYAPKLYKLDAHKPGLDASVMLSGDDHETSISLSISKETTGAPQLVGPAFIPDKLNPPTD